MGQVLEKVPLFPTLPTYFDDFFTKNLFDWNESAFGRIAKTLPSVNLKELTDSFVIELAAPGMKKEDFKVQLQYGLLTISAERREEIEEKGEKGEFLRQEYNYESFTRSFTLPENARDEEIKATYSNGILKLIIHKMKPQAVVSPKAIPVK